MFELASLDLQGLIISQENLIMSELSFLVCLGNLLISHYNFNKYYDDTRQIMCLNNNHRANR